MSRLLMTLACGLSAVAVTACSSVRGAVDAVFQPDLRAEMSDSDVHMAVATMQAALESEADGGARSWTNPETGNGGSISPLETYQTDAGYYCRTFSEAVTVGGRTAAYEDEACRSEDGVWLIAGS